MAAIPSLITAALNERLAKLRFPTLFLVLAGVFLIDLVVPDIIPFVDELLLGIATLIVASLRRSHDAAEN